MLCVGLDPDPTRFPESVDRDARGVLDFCRTVVDATAHTVCSFKPQIAYFSALGAERELELLCAHIRSSAPDAVLILDAKRGDIGSTAERYAVEAFERYGADAVTVNPYLGTDSLEPFLAHRDKGTIVLGDGPLRCQKPLFAPTLNADGTLAFCSYATAPMENFGPVPRHDFARWWQTDVVLENQRRFLDNGGTDACRACYFRGDHVPTMLYTVGLRELPADIRLQRPVRSAEFLGYIRRAVRNAPRSPAS